jgi:hypothetical protein
MLVLRRDRSLPRLAARLARGEARRTPSGAGATTPKACATASAALPRTSSVASRIRCDWDPQYIADAWINAVEAARDAISPSYVGEPDCNGVIERFMRTLKEQCLYQSGSGITRRRRSEPRRWRPDDDRRRHAIAQWRQDRRSVGGPLPCIPLSVQKTGCGTGCLRPLDRSQTRTRAFSRARHRAPHRPRAAASAQPRRACGCAVGPGVLPFPTFP